MKYRTRAAPSPPIISMNSEPFMDKNGTEASVATALASNVFPQPGGPNNSAPLGTLKTTDTVYETFESLILME